MGLHSPTIASVRKEWRWVAFLWVLALATSCGPGIQSHKGNDPVDVQEVSGCRPTAEAELTAATLVDRLATAPPEAVQCQSRASGFFLPLARVVQPDEGTSNVLSSAPLRQLVAMGAVAIPELLRHLDNDRPTGFGGSPLANNPHMMFRYLEHTEEVDPYDREALALLARRAKSLPADDDARAHQLTVGDLCFYALGQIVNRYYLPFQFPAKFTAIVTSPIRFPGMVQHLRQQWGTLDTAQHMAQLSSEMAQAGTSRFREDTWLRLQHYYPKAAGQAAFAVFAKERENPSRWHSLGVLISATLPGNAPTITREVEATLTGLLALPAGHDFLGLTCVDFLVARRSGLDLAESYATSAAQGRNGSPFHSRLEQIRDARR